MTGTFSVSRDAYQRIKSAAGARGVSIAVLVEQALAAKPWSTVGVRSTAEAMQQRVVHQAPQSHFAKRELLSREQLAALASRRSTHVTLTQRCSLDVPLAVMELLDDRLARLRELHGVEMTRAELFDRVVNAVLDQEGRGA